jgi:hypothetical protein
LLLAAVYVPSLAQVLHTQAPHLSGWPVIAILSAVPLAVGQISRARIMAGEDILQGATRQ